MNILICGRRGEGKSTLGLYVAQSIQRNRAAHTILIFDPKRTYTAIPHTSDMEHFLDLIEQPGNVAVAFQPFAAPRGDSKADQDAVFNDFTEFCDSIGIEKHLGVTQGASRPTLGPVILIVDESWFLQSASGAHPWIERLVRLADSDNFFLIQLAHRPGDFASRVRAQADEFFFFRQWLPGDIEIISDLCGDECAEIVAKLPPHHVLRYRVSRGEFETWDKPHGWHQQIKGGTDGPGNVRPVVNAA